MRGSPMWGDRVPRGYRDNILFRQWWLKKCASSKRLRLATVEACREDILFWINAFCIQQNKDAMSRFVKTVEGKVIETGSTEFKIGPFVTYPFQDRAIAKINDAVEYRHDLVIEKSRDMGASYILLFKALHVWLFSKGDKVSVLSKEEKAVSDASSDSLFSKMEDVLSWHPEWLLPAKWEKTKLLFWNESAKNEIHGFAASKSATIGGRSLFILLDEFTKMGNAADILSMTRDNSACRIFNFTHDGIGTEAHKLTERPDMHKLVMHWSDHPEKNRGLYKTGRTINDVKVLDKTYQYPPDFEFVLGDAPGGKCPLIRSPWYDNECKVRKISRDIAMNLDIDPAGSSSQWFDVVDLRQYAATYCRKPIFVGDFLHDGDEPSKVPFSENVAGRLKLWISPKADGSVPADDYIIACDPSEGMGSTPTCVSIVNTAGVKVGSWSSAHVEPIDMAPFLVAMAKLFQDPMGNGARLIWETPGPGNRLGRYIIDLGYRSIYYSETLNTAIMERQTETPGYHANPAAKKFMMESYRDALARRQFVNREIEAIENCSGWFYGTSQQPCHAKEKVSDDPASGGVNHGDKTIADALAWVLIRKAGKVRMVADLTEETEEVQVGSLKWRMMLHDIDRQKQSTAVWV